MIDFNKLTPGTKVVDIIQDNGHRLDGQVLEVVMHEGEMYLASARSMWSIYQFNPEDYEYYYGDAKVGQYIN